MTRLEWFNSGRCKRVFPEGNRFLCNLYDKPIEPWMLDLVFRLESFVWNGTPCHRTYISMNQDQADTEVDPETGVPL